MIREVLLPRSLGELWRTLSVYPEATIYAGGTDLFPRMRKGVDSPASLVCLERISELRNIRDHGDTVFLGSCTTHTRLLSASLVRDHFPVLVKSLATLGSPHIRNMGTLGGNIVTASPAGDALPALYVLGAEIEILSATSRRRVPIGEFIIGAGKVDLSHGEIVSGVWLRKEQPFRIHHFEKVGQRNALAIAIVSMAALIDITDKCVIRRARLAWGSVGPTVVVSEVVGTFLKGRPLDAQTLSKAASLVREAVRPIDDIRATASYRREIAGNLLMRLLVSRPSCSSCPSW